MSTPEQNAAAGKNIDTKVVNLLYSMIKNFNGTVNFDAVAKENGSPNAEAARKRFRRFLDKENIPLAIKGDVIGDGAIQAGENVTVAPKTAESTAKNKCPRTPRTSKAPKTPRATNGTASKKRKIAEAAEGEVDDAEDDVGNVNTEVKDIGENIGDELK